MIRAAPELDMSSAPLLGAQVLDSLADGERRLVIDFADVRLIDSAGLGVLLSAQRRARMAGGELTVANLSSHVHHVLAVTGVGRALGITP